MTAGEIIRRGVVRLGLFVGTVAVGVATAAPAAGNGSGLDEAERPGERIYRDGTLPNGDSMRAIVAGDIPVDGTLFPCVNCHRPSGLGSLEGPVIAWPVAGRELFAPRRRAGTWNPAKQRQGPGAPERWMLPSRLRIADARAAYTDDTLARAIRTGVDPEGRILSRAMPRYDLSDQDMAALIRYLKGLSAAIDPGADEQTLRFATVVSDGVEEADRVAMLSVLQAHIDARNTQTRPYQRRARSGPFYKTESYGAYRKLALDVWELTGTPDTWREQLEAHYRDRPVFALLGGIVDGPWSPVHRFCEDHRVPAIFPVTDRPVVSDSDWYTLYFSKGLYQEGEAAARFLGARGSQGEGPRVLQVFRSGGKGEEAARGFGDTWGRLTGGAPYSLPLEADEPLPPAPWTAAGMPGRPTALLLWLGGDDLITALDPVPTQYDDTVAVFVSWRLAEGDLGRIPRSARDRLYATYPYSLPRQMEKRFRGIERWLQARGIQVGSRDVLAEMYFLGWMLPGAISQMRSELYRDYFLEAFDMMPEQDYAIAVFPRVSFGPGQRYAAKGCYIVRLSPDPEPRPVKASGWVVD